MPHSASDALPLLDAEAAVRRLGGHVGLYRRACALFARDALPLAGEVEVALGAGDLAQAAAKAHQLKGSAGWIGASRVHRLATACELECDDGRPAPSLALRLREAVEATVQAIIDLQAQSPASA